MLMDNAMQAAHVLRQGIIATGYFDIVDKQQMPLVAFAMKRGQLSHGDETQVLPFTLFHLQDHLRARGWTVPAYTCPRGAEHLTIMRVVVRPDLTVDLVNLLLRDIRDAIDHLNRFFESTHVKEAMQLLVSVPDEHKSAAIAAKVEEMKQQFLSHVRESVKHQHKHRQEKKPSTGVC